MKWETVIGLEVHAQLNTTSKLFSGSAVTFGEPANTHTSLIDAAFPGTLPMVNAHAIQLAIQFGLAIHANINSMCFFERKNYFYPDLPKGYQISQLRRPIIGQGYLTLANQKKIIIDHAHLEEDAGKSLHDVHPGLSGIDLNRAGTPLLEIVTTPCLRSAAEAVEYLKSLHQLLRFLNICDGNMQEGSFRCDVNLSIRPQGEQKLGTRTELKNLNSFKFIEKAILFEEHRHQALLSSGHSIHQETRLYSPEHNTTHAIRDKETQHDYRYFPDPDLLPIEITPDFIQNIQHQMPERPETLRAQLIEEDALTMDEVDFLLTSPMRLNYYTEVKKQTKAPIKTLINWLKGTYVATLREQGLEFEQTPLSTTQFARLLDRMVDQIISTKTAQQLLAQLLTTDIDLDTLIDTGGHKTIQNDAHLEKLIFDLIAKHPTQVAEYQAGKQKLLAFFIGQLMKQTKGQATPEAIHRLLIPALNKA